MMKGMWSGAWLLVLGVLLALAGPAAAGPGDLVWAKSAGGTAYESACGVAAMADGGVVIVGYFGGSITFGDRGAQQRLRTTADEDNSFVARYNADGTLAWAKWFGGEGDTTAFEVTAMKDGGITVVGYLTGEVLFGKGEDNETTLTSVDDTPDIFVARFTGAGELVWVTSAGGEGFDAAISVSEAPDGGVMVAGTLDGEGVFGDDEDNETNLEGDAFVAHYQQDGTLAWARAFTSDSTICCAVAAREDGGAVAAGCFSGRLTISVGEDDERRLRAQGSGDAFLACFNADGTLAWAKRAGGQGYAQHLGIDALPDGGVIVSGEFSGSISLGVGEPAGVRLRNGWDEEENPEDSDSYVARFNADGTLAWARQIGGSGAVSGYHIVTLPGGGAVVGGHYAGEVIFAPGEDAVRFRSTGGTQDIFLACYAADGTLAWARSAGGADDEMGIMVAAGEDSVFFTGNYAGSLAFPGTQTRLRAAGSNDVFLARYSLK